MEFLSPEFIKVILNAGLSVVLALVVIYWYRCDSLDQLREEKERSCQERSDKILIIDILKENGIVKTGDIAVVTAGVVDYAKRHEPAASTNIMRVVNID